MYPALRPGDGKPVGELGLGLALVEGGGAKGKEKSVETQNKSSNPAQTPAFYASNKQSPFTSDAVLRQKGQASLTTQTAFLADIEVEPLNPLATTFLVLPDRLLYFRHLTHNPAIPWQIPTP